MFKKNKEVGLIPAGSIERGRRVYVQVSAFGEVNDKDKSVLSFGYKGKQIALVNKPLSTLGVWFIDSLLFLARYSNSEAATADFSEFKAYLDSLKLEDPKKKETIS